MAVTVYSTVEAIRRHPNNQQLLYDLSVRKGYSALNEETWDTVLYNSITAIK